MTSSEVGTSSPELKPTTAAAVSTILVGLVGIVIFPLLAFASVSVGATAIGSIFWSATTLLVPFLSLQHPDETPLVTNPIFFSLVQWGFLLLLNVSMVARGYSKRPLVSAIMLALVTIGLSLLTISIFGFSVGKVRN